MSLGLDRIDSAPISNRDFDPQFLQWIWVLVDALNENLTDIENVVLSINPVSETTQEVAVNSLYIPGNSALTSFYLPAEMMPGDKVAIAGEGSGGWILLTAAGQTIQIADVGATASTSVSSSSRYDSIEIVCVVANTTWITLSTQTTGFIIV
jgi:hypothetical protein